MTALVLRLRSEARSRWHVWLGLALLLAIAGGAATAAAAGARRTQTAYPRFYVAQKGFDVFTGGFPDNIDPERAMATIERLPAVKEWARSDVVAGAGFLPDGNELTIPQLAAVTDLQGKAGIEINRFKVLSGRLFDLGAPDEALVDFGVAERYRLKVGSVIRLVVGNPFGPHGGVVPRPKVASVRVVGIVASPGNFPAVGISSLFTVIYTTPAFARANHVIPNPPDASLIIRLRGGSAGLGTFLREKRAAGLGDVDIPVVEKVQTAGIQRSMRFETQALWAMAALIAVTALAVLGQALARQSHLESGEFPTLRSVGVSRHQLFGLGVARASIIGLVAAAASIPVAILLSPLTPIGLARVAEPSPGIRIDVPALFLGAAAIMLLTVAVTILPAHAAARSAVRFSGQQAGGEHPSALAGALARTWSSPAGSAGLSMALEPGRGRDAVPVRSAVLGSAIGIAALAASLLFASSLRHVLGTPRLSGFTWDALVADQENPPQTANALRADRRVAGFSRGGYATVRIGGISLFALVTNGSGPAHPIISEGRAPVSAGEIALGVNTLRSAHKAIGDTIEVSLDTADNPPPPVRMRIVGTVIVPPAPFGVSRPGEGVALSYAGWAHVDPTATQQASGAPFLVTFRSGVSEEAGIAAMRRDSPTAFIVPAERPGDVSSLQRIASVPVLLAVLLALMAMGVLAHTLITSIRRRRRDLAVLKTLGFQRLQLAGVVAWQATVLAVAALLVGLPVGVAVGRWTWTVFANQLGILPDPVIPVGSVLVAFPAALVLANLIAALPGRSAARTQAALVLRSE